MLRGWAQTNMSHELEELLRIKRRRLSALRRQIAQFGYNAPVELTTERDELEQELGVSSKVVDPIIKGELPDDIMAAIRAYGIPASVNNALQLVNAGLYDLKKAFDEHRVELHGVKEQVLPIAADVQALKKDNEDGKRGRARNFYLFLLVILMLTVIAAVVIALALQVFGP